MGVLVDADALIKALNLAEWFNLADFNEAVYTVRKAQPVDAVPVRHGWWIDIDSETYTWKIRCSKCGHERSMMSTGQTYPMYCEDCGARMDGKDGDHHDKR